VKGDGDGAGSLRCKVEVAPQSRAYAPTPNFRQPLRGGTSMAKPSQTFKKRQRENKLREKAQLKRERRQQRQSEKKASQAVRGEHHEAPSGRIEVDSLAQGEAAFEQND
jgi:hypothetical protein